MERRNLLVDVMRETGITQSNLSLMSGVRQPSISQFLSGRVELSDRMLDRLLSCMGYQLEVVRKPVRPRLRRSEERSWRLHREISRRLDGSTLSTWQPIMLRNLGRLRGQVTGQPHLKNLDRWQQLVDDGDLLGMHRVLTGLDRDSMEMREVSPMTGILTQEERLDTLGLAS
jgi:transcriptional regulator with XRE-family HTH domain